MLQLNSWSHRSLSRGAGGLFAAIALTAAAGTTVVARKIVSATTRPGGKADDIHIVEVGVRAGRAVVGLRGDDQTRSAACFAISLDAGRTIARLGPPLAAGAAGPPVPTGAEAGTVYRPVLGIDRGSSLRLGTARTVTSFFSGSPARSLGLPTENVAIPGELGDLPAWLTPGAPTGALAPHQIWAVLAHGHGATRDECLRAVPVLHRLGVTCLVTSYRNDEGAPPSADQSSHLGSDEWSDVDATIGEALARGAERIVIVGWSMGGGIALRTSLRGRHRDAIAALVLNAPAIDWADIIDHNARFRHAPAPSRWLALELLRAGFGTFASGLDAPIDLDTMSSDYYAEHLTAPTLILHSRADTYVPSPPSERLAAERPDLVRYAPFDSFGHCREWNAEPERWEREVAGFLTERFASA